MISHGNYQVKAIDYTKDGSVYELINFDEEERRSGPKVTR